MQSEEERARRVGATAGLATVVANATRGAFSVLTCRGLLESRCMRFAGQVGADVAWEYAVCRAKRSEHAALMVDSVKEANSLDSIIARVPVRKFSVCAR